MLLDEPTQGMGREDVGRVVALIRKLSAGRTVLMVEHNLSVVADLSDTITVFARGSVLPEGGYAEVSRDPAGLEAYIGSRLCPVPSSRTRSQDRAAGDPPRAATSCSG